VVVVTWAVLTQQGRPVHRAQSDPDCAFSASANLEWVYIGPVLLLLATNTFFLISIFAVVVTKLRSTGERGEPADHQNWKAAKALLVIIPLLGITYIITILGPPDSSTTSHALFVHLRAALLSTQGFMVTLPYCFLNTEVRGILRHHWDRCAD
jgi:corticotropin releasing hormone receptor 1